MENADFAKDKEKELGEIWEKEEMRMSGWRAPEYSHILLTQEMQRQFNASQGGAVDHSYLYLDPYSSSEWSTLSNQQQYLNTFENLPIDWTEWLSKHIYRHLEKTSFSKTKIDVIGLGSGDGKNETLLCKGLLKFKHLERLRCFFMDTSPTLVTEAHRNFANLFANQTNAESKWLLGNFHNLTRYDDIFDNPEDQNILRVVCMFGGTFGNLRHEILFIQQSLRALKEHDILVLDVSLGFAPYEDLELVKKEDPRLFENKMDDLEHWMKGIILRNRPKLKDISFQNVLKTNISTFAKTYSIEPQAIVDGKACFSMPPIHRYDSVEFMKTFANEGYKPLDGRCYSYKKKQLLAIFAKR